MEDNALIIKDIMKNNELSEFVAIEDGLISDVDKEEIVSEYIDGTNKINKKVDLIKMAYLYVQGYDTAAMSRAFNVPTSTIATLRCSEKFKSIITALNNEIVSTARTFLTASSMKATLTLLKCMDSTDDKTRLKAATEVMDRIGLKTPQQIELIQKGDKLAQMSEEELMNFVKSGMKEIRAIGKGVEDGDNKLETT